MSRALVSTVAAALVAAGTLAVAGAPGRAAALDDTPWVLPATPPRCTTAQVDAGDVAGCLVVSYAEPASSGWGTPPAPGVGPGWTWTGSTYSGSPALAAWESTYITTNAVRVAGLAAGRLATHAGAQALFEGFLDEVAANGYRIRDAGGYSFRCTAGNGGWDCPSGDPGDLSNHSWGLAIDINSGTNPIRTYTRTGTATACATPVQTDLPRWVIQTAERWGLYWGGYGWSNGCASAATERDAVERDPPHFEFRGTPAQAAAIAAHNLHADPNVVCFATVDARGADAEQCNRTGKPAAGARLAVQLAPPAGAVAALVNLTASDADGPGFLTLDGCAAHTGDYDTSTLTFAPGAAVATMAIAPLDARGRLCVWRSTAVHSVVDVFAYLGPNGAPDGTPAGGAPLGIVTGAPTRLADTRATGACPPGGTCQAGRVPDAGVHAIAGAAGAVEHTGDGTAADSGDGPGDGSGDGTVAWLANVAVIDGAGPGYVQAGRCDEVTAASAYSNVNYADARVRSNLALVAGGGSGACAFVLRAAHVIVDELARLVPGDGLGWRLTGSRRALDTRQCTPAWCGGRPAAGTLLHLDLGTDAPAAAVAVTVTDTRGPGYVTVGRCSDLAGVAGRGAATSNLNHTAGQTVTNLAIVALDHPTLGHGEMCAFTLASAHVIVDVQAELVPSRAIATAPVAPQRVHDSRVR